MIAKEEDASWITINGTHVQVDSAGNIITGPDSLKALSQQGEGVGPDTDGEHDYKPMVSGDYSTKTQEGKEAAQEAWAEHVSTSVTAEQWESINGQYVGNPKSFGINKTLRENPGAALEDILSGEDLEAAKAIEEAISRNTLASDTLLTRNLKESFLADTLQISRSDLTYIVDHFDDPDIQGSLNGMVGGKITESGFVSTSGNPNLNMFSTRLVRLEISAPKGTNALVTQNFMESEVILGRGTTYEIEGFDKFDTDGQGYDFGLTIKVKVV